MPRGDRSSYGGLKHACQAVVASGAHQCGNQGYIEREGRMFCVQHVKVYDSGALLQVIA